MLVAVFWLCFPLPPNVLFRKPRVARPLLKIFSGPVWCDTVRLQRLKLPNSGSGPIRANRFAVRTRIANILCELILASKKKTFLLRIDLPKNGIAARIGRESREP